MKRITILFFSLLSLLAISFTSDNGKTFSSITGENLQSKKINIPNDTKGKYTLIGVAYSQKAQSDLEGWFQPVYTTFIEKPGEDALFDDSYDVNVYFIAMFTGANESMYGPAKKKLQEDLDPELKPHVLLYKGDITKYKTDLSLEDNDKPYFFLLDKEGKIVYTTSGAYTDEKLEKAEELIEE